MAAEYTYSNTTNFVTPQIWNDSVGKTFSFSVPSPLQPLLTLKPTDSTGGTETSEHTASPFQLTEDEPESSSLTAAEAHFKLFPSQSNSPHITDCFMHWCRIA